VNPRKRLFVCCDGTWNSPSQIDGGLPVPTNVRKFFVALREGPCSDGVVQERYYHPGVGTTGWLLARLWDGFLGTGLSRNIQSAYYWLAHHYCPGDEIFLIGFSRGAFTVRSLTGMISHSGLWESPSWKRVAEAYGNYRIETADGADAGFKRAYRDQPGNRGAVPVHFVGVWDTVGALGVPFIELLASRNRFHDPRLSPNVRHARHGLALDELRAPFSASLWEQKEPLPPGNTLQQVWFPGVHADVGGGYRETELSDIAMHWMLDEARAAGAEFEPQFVRQIPPGDPQGVAHLTDKGFFGLLGLMPRSVPAVLPGSTGHSGQSVHASALSRQDDPPIEQAPYRPTRRLAIGEKSEPMEIYAREKWNATPLYLEAGATYRFSAHGEWMDWYQKSGPAGTARNPWHGLAVLLKEPRWIHLLNPLTETVQWLLFWARRSVTAPWMALIGAVGDAGNPQVHGMPAKMTQFTIGAQTVQTPENGGYFYAFANDARPMHYNNRGCVTVEVERIA
jgi:hypothetical protein